MKNRGYNKFLFFIPAFVASAAVSATAFANDPPPYGTVKIKSVSAIGSGCPDSSTYNANISDDGQAFTVAFSQFQAELGPGIPLSESRKNCSLTATLKFPAGYQYSIATFTYRGFMDLDYKVKAEHTTQYYFQGQLQTGKFVAAEYGPKVKNFIYSEKLGLVSVYIPDTWSPCNIDRALIINPSVRVSKLYGASRNAQGLIANDTIDGELKQVYGFVWRKCQS